MNKHSIQLCREMNKGSLFYTAEKSSYNSWQLAEEPGTK